MEPSTPPQAPVLIIGAGVVGLTLAQSLAKSRIPFYLFERDATSTSRGHHGWGLSIHWALDTLKSCLPDHVTFQLHTAQVDPAHGGANDTGRFAFLNLETLVPRYVIPPAPRLRVHRRKFREVLMDGLDVQWGKEVEGFTETKEGFEIAFRDGTKYNGSLLVGADGANSKIRQLLCPDTYQLYQLPCRFMGTTVKLTPQQMAPLQAIDPLLFQGCHPQTGTFMWFSVLSTPETNGSAGEGEYFEGQIGITWKVTSPEDEMPTTSEARLKKMKLMARPFEETLRRVIEECADDSEVMDIRLRDWPRGEWPDHNGKVTLIGDAAHAMTMFRGEGANHGITDSSRLHDTILSFYKGDTAQSTAMAEFKTEMRARTGDAVLLSRQACLDAHDWEGLRDDSPLVSKRAIVRERAMVTASS